MPIRDFADGETISAADFNRYFMQQHVVVKPVTESVANSTTTQDDDHLSVPVVAGTDYWVVALILYDGNSAADLKISWSAPSGSTFDYVSDALGSGTTGSVGQVSRTHQQLGNTPSPGAVGAGSPVASLAKGILRVGQNSGTFRFRWAQLTANATPTRVLARSTLTLRRLTT